MPTIEESESITLTLPRSLIIKLDELANSMRTTRDLEVQALIEDRIRREKEGREAFERLSEMYRGRMEREGKANQTSEEIMEELRQLREEVANELYPD
jgi:hypothetical protein